MRYDQLLDLIDEIKPRTIVEVGVARAERACAMCERALRYRPDMHYVGYDVFETKDARFQADAFNLKKVDSRAAVAAKMSTIVQRHERFSFELVVGDTRETLHGRTVVCDLAFIDGDHRCDAIAGDYEALKDSGVVVLDDYYTADVRGCPDTEFIGCNRLVERLAGKASLLPARDPVWGGGLVQMAIVRR